MTSNEALDLIIVELEKALKKHPDWPKDKIHCAAILGEEAGELIQASIDFEYAKSFKSKSNSYKNMKIEAAQVGAMAIRFLVNIDKNEV
jgi:hypothetical protein